MADTFDKKRIGSIWAKKSKAGNDYFSGVIEVNGKELNFMAFSNRNPKGPSSPAHFIYEADPPRGQDKPMKEVTGKTPAKPKATKPAPVEETEPDEAPL